jgi:hypothetical protein
LKSYLQKRQYRRQSVADPAAPLQEMDRAERGHTYTAIDALFFKQRSGQLEALVFVGPRIEDHQGIRAETLDLGDVMRVKSTSLVQSARVGIDVSTTCFIDMEANRLSADRTLCGNRVNSPPTQQLDELHHPNA